jgi:hypothetical protein
VRYEVGDGFKVLFWHDVWCEELPLKILFLELFTIACGRMHGHRRICRPRLICGMSIPLGNRIVITENKREWNGMECLFLLFSLVITHIL